MRIRRSPFLYFGLPFLGVMVGASFALGTLTQTRYDLRDTKVHAITKEEELHMKQGRRKLDLREEYYRLGIGSSDVEEDWVNKRVERLPGQGQFGELPSGKGGKDSGREESNLVKQI